MRHRQWSIAAVAVTAIVLGGCNDGTYKAASHEEPAHLEDIPGTDVKRVVLTEKATARLGIRTDTVREEAVAGGPAQRVVPFSAVLYAPTGETWAYTNPAPRTFVRQRVSVGDIRGDQAFLADGPAAGTAVVTVGVAELYGTEFEVGH